MATAKYSVLVRVNGYAIPAACSQLAFFTKGPADTVLMIRLDELRITKGNCFLFLFPNSSGTPEDRAPTTVP